MVVIIGVDMYDKHITYDSHSDTKGIVVADVVVVVVEEVVVIVVEVIVVIVVE